LTWQKTFKDRFVVLKNIDFFPEIKANLLNSVCSKLTPEIGAFML